MTNKISLIAAAILIIGLGGCATTNEMYYWGEYENLLYTMYKKPGSATPIEQIEKLNTDIQKAAAAGKKVPPGLYAHLGVMYAAQGKPSQSLEAFNQEKSLYPESTHFIDGMLRRAQVYGANQ